MAKQIKMGLVKPFTTAPAGEMEVPITSWRQPCVHPESMARNLSGMGGGVPDTPVKDVEAEY